MTEIRSIRLSGDRGPSADTLRRAMGRFATGVAVVTAQEGGQPLGFTCQSVVSLSLDPPLLALAPAKSSTSWPRMALAGTFCVNILSEAQAGEARRFAVSGGDKFSGVPWRPGPSGAPVLKGCLVAIHCRLELVHDAGDHEIVIGTVTDIEFGDYEPPLIFFQSSYRRIGTSLTPSVADRPAGSRQLVISAFAGARSATGDAREQLCPWP